MAEINWNIIDANTPSKIATSFQDGQQNALARQSALQAQQLNALQLQKATNEMESEAAFTNALAQHGGDVKKALPVLMQKNPKMALGYQKMLQEQKTAELTQQKAKLESAQKTLEVGGQLFSQVRDQATWESALQQLSQIVPPEVLANMPAQYDPAFVKQKLGEAMTLKDQIANKWKELDHNLSLAKFGYQQRHDSQALGVQSANQQLAERRLQLLEDGGGAKPPSGYRFKQDGSLEFIENGPADPKNPLNQQKTAPKPLPASTAKLQNEELTSIGTFAGLDADLAGFEKQIEDGKLKFGLVSNLVNTGRNKTGISTEESRNLESFKTKLENLRNSVLLLNKGVQTEGDAQRAMNEIMTDINDKDLVKQRLQELRALNERAVTLRKNNVDSLRATYGHEPFDFGKYENQPGTTNLTPPTKDIHAEAEAILRGK